MRRSAGSSSTSKRLFGVLQQTAGALPGPLVVAPASMPRTGATRPAPRRRTTCGHGIAYPIHQQLDRRRRLRRRVHGRLLLRLSASARSPTSSRREASPRRLADLPPPPSSRPTRRSLRPQTWLGTYLKDSHEEPPGYTLSYATASFVYHPGRPVNVSTSFLLHSVSELDELGFTFVAHFTLILSWEDDRINAPCVAFGRDGNEEDASDPCSYFWRPSYTFKNLLMTEGGFEVLEDLGFYAEPGVNLRVGAANRNVHLNHGLAYQMQRIRAVFLSPMGSPTSFDCQNLQIRILAAPDMPRSEVRFVPKAALDAELTSYAAPMETTRVSRCSGWNVTVSSRRRSRTTLKPLKASSTRPRCSTSSPTRCSTSRSSPCRMSSMAWCARPRLPPVVSPPPSPRRQRNASAPPR